MRHAQLDHDADGGGGGAPAAPTRTTNDNNTTRSRLLGDEEEDDEKNSADDTTNAVVDLINTRIPTFSMRRDGRRDLISAAAGGLGGRSTVGQQQSMTRIMQGQPPPASSGSFYHQQSIFNEAQHQRHQQNSSLLFGSGGRGHQQQHHLMITARGLVAPPPPPLVLLSSPPTVLPALSSRHHSSAALLLAREQELLLMREAAGRGLLQQHLPTTSTTSAAAGGGGGLNSTSRGVDYHDAETRRKLLLQSIIEEERMRREAISSRASSISIGGGDLRVLSQNAAYNTLAGLDTSTSNTTNRAQTATASLRKQGLVPGTEPPGSGDSIEDAYRERAAASAIFLSNKYDDHHVVNKNNKNLTSADGRGGQYLDSASAIASNIAKHSSQWDGTPAQHLLSSQAASSTATPVVGRSQEEQQRATISTSSLLNVPQHPNSRLTLQQEQHLQHRILPSTVGVAAASALARGRAVSSTDVSHLSGGGGGPSHLSLHQHHSNIAAVSSYLQLQNYAAMNGLTMETPMHTNNSALLLDNVKSSITPLQSLHLQEESDQFWKIQFQQLKRFKEEYGHCHVPVYYKSNVILGQWVNAQRHAYREYKSSGGKTNLMNEERTALLEDIGFACKKKPGLLWMAQYNLLKEFKEENGHPHVPMHWKKDRKLGHWVNNQRQLYRKYKSGLPTSMNESRIELLEEIGFAWVLGKDWKEKRKEDTCKSSTDKAILPENDDESCSNKLETPNSFVHDEDYKEDNNEDVEVTMEDIKNGNLQSASVRTNEDENLVNLESSDKYQYIDNAREQRESAKVSIDEEEERSSLASDTKPLTTTKPGNGRLKRKRLTTIPAVEMDGRIISHILFSGTPGQLETGDTSSDSDDSSTDDTNVRRRNLKKMKIQYNTDKHWNKRFEDLTKFKEIHGHCHVPFQYSENKSLSYWVSNQRQKYKAFLRGEECTLTKGRIDALLSIGFKFNARDATGENSRLEEREQKNAAGDGCLTLKARISFHEDPHWDARMIDLKDYKKRCGDCSVPPIYLPNRKLGFWVLNQKKFYRRYTNGQRSPLDANKIEELNQLGFSWSLDSKWKRQPFYKERANNFAAISGELTCYILSFLWDINDIMSFSATTKSCFEFFNDSEHANRLLINVYSYKYGTERLLNMTEWCPSQSMSMLDTWRDTSKVKVALRLQTSLDEKEIALADDSSAIYVRTREGLGILSPRKESQAILIDNSTLVPSKDKTKYCEGYCGMIRFNIHPPGMSDNVDSMVGQFNVRQQIALWGDFDGIRVCDSVEDLLISQNGNAFHSVGTARFGRVSTVIPAPSFHTKSDRILHPRRPSLYLGCASGAVIGLFPVPGNDETKTDFDYGMSAMTFAHSGSATTLSVLHAPAMSAAGGGDFLLSAGLDGKVYLYPNSFSVRHQFEIHSRVLCCEHKSPIISLASNEKDSHFFIYTGDESGKIIIWKSRPGSTLRRPQGVNGRGTRPMSNFEAIFTMSSPDSGNKVTKLSLFRRNVLVAGYNAGDVRVFDIVQKKTYVKKARKKAIKPNASLRLSQRLFVPIAHPGRIYSITFFGDILLTTGSNDGATKAWSMVSGDLLGTLTTFHDTDSSMLCSQKGLSHTEKRVFSYEGLKTAIVSNIFCDRKMISINRYGQICCWNFGELLEQKFVDSSETKTDEVNSKSVGGDQIEASGSEHFESYHRPVKEMDQSNSNEQKAESDDDSGDSDEEDDDSDAEFSWKCQACHTINTTSFSRCSSCYEWRSIQNK